MNAVCKNDLIRTSPYCLCDCLLLFFHTSGAIHRERRHFLRGALKELFTVLEDEPGLLGPKVKEPEFWSLTVTNNKKQANSSTSWTVFHCMVLKMHQF